MCDARVEIGQRRILGDEAAHEVAAAGADLRADVVQHHAPQQARAGGRNPHGEQPAEAGADGDDLVQMQRRAQVQHIAQAGLGRIARHIGAAARRAAPGIVRRHHAATGADRAGNLGKVRAGAHQAGQAQQRGVRVAGVPLVHRERQAVPGRDAMN